MVDPGALGETILFEDPIDLFFFAPHDVPVVSIGLPPFAVVESSVDTVAEGSLELDVLTGYNSVYGGFG